MKNEKNQVKLMVFQYFEKLNLLFLINITIQKVLKESPYQGYLGNKFPHI